MLIHVLCKWEQSKHRLNILGSKIDLNFKQAGVELGLTQAETVSLELGLIKG